MKSRNHPVTRRFAGLAVWALCGAALAEGGRPAVPLLPRYVQECAACHVAYPPGMLPAASWERLMKTLPQHFGNDASLDAATQRDLSRWLQANAGGGAPPPQDRITRSAWFVREHNEIPAAVWQRPAIRQASNCAACHTRADQGDFNEHTVRIPR
ncbi:MULTISPECIES: diheme cytochrome c [Ramlibacter]|nr:MULTISPECIES: diheme cytochrome c [Ramlibacter]